MWYGSVAQICSGCFMNAGVIFSSESREGKNRTTFVCLGKIFYFSL